MRIDGPFNFYLSSIIADAILIQMGHILPMDKSIQFPLTLIFGQAQENDKRIQPNASNCFMNLNKPA